MPAGDRGLPPVVPSRLRARPSPPPPLSQGMESLAQLATGRLSGRPATDYGAFIAAFENACGSGEVALVLRSGCDHPLFRRGVRPVGAPSCERSGSSPVAAVSHWLLRLLSSLLSAISRRMARAWHA